MRANYTLCLCALALPLVAQEPAIQRQPVVVYSGPKAVDARPYYRRLTRPNREGVNVTVPEGAGVQPLAQQLPLRPKRLRAGQPGIRLREGQVTPLFVMGMDAISSRWFSEQALALAKLGARGVVVQADRWTDWLELQHRARQAGIELALMPGDAFAEGYEIDQYPVLMVSPEQAREMRDE